MEQKRFTIKTEKNLQLCDYGFFQELAREITNEVFRGEKINYVGSGKMAWLTYSFDVTVNSQSWEAVIEYASKTCTFTRGGL